MTVRRIRTLPDPVLRRRAKRVSTIDGSVQKLIDDMVETMQQANGVGLAAPQVGVSLRVVVLQMPGEPPMAIINPQIVKRSGEREVAEALGEDGRRIVIEGQDLAKILTDDAISVSVEDAREMIEELRAYPALSGARGRGVDLEALEGLLLGVSDLVKARPQLLEMDLNPVFLSEDGYRICDARIIQAP